jgi:hypothetical protein
VRIADGDAAGDADAVQGEAHVLETTAGRARWCVWAGGCREARRRQAGACNDERQRLARDQAFQPVRSGPTPVLSLIERRSLE